MPVRLNVRKVAGRNQPDERMSLEQAAERALDLIVADAASSPASGGRMSRRRELDGFPALILSDQTGDAVDPGLLRSSTGASCGV